MWGREGEYEVWVNKVPVSMIVSMIIKEVKSRLLLLSQSALPSI
jgi:hypothetical protein